MKPLSITIEKGGFYVVEKCRNEESAYFLGWKLQQCFFDCFALDNLRGLCMFLENRSAG